MLVRIGAYGIAFVTLAVIEIPFLPVSIAVAYGLKNVKRLYPWFTLILDAIKIVAAIYFAGWLIEKIGQSPSWLMFLIPGYLLFHNGMTRVSRAKKGISRVRLALQRRGEPVSYDQADDIRLELMHLKGDMIGLFIGSCITLQSASFF